MKAMAKRFDWEVERLRLESLLSPALSSRGGERARQPIKQKMTPVKK
jgi:hypothetical protein